MKLSLFNIQRNRFIEDYETIKEELKKSRETLDDYNAKIEKINLELTTATCGSAELKKQLNEVKKEKENKELELQELLKRQEEKIDEYTAKTDYSKYVLEVESTVDKTKIDNGKTLQYLATGKYLLQNLDDTADFAPVIIQYGRAVEFEMIKWVNDFKGTLHIDDINNWCDNTNYTNKIRQVFTDLGLPVVNDNYLIDPNNKVNLFNLKKYINSSPIRLVFGELTQIFELFHYISPRSNPTKNYNFVPLMLAFSNYLKSLWRDYDTAEGLFNTCRNILDLRNCAGHTYTDTVCVSDIIDKRTAENYVAQVEALFICL